MKTRSSFAASLLSDALDHGGGAVAVDEHPVGDAPDVLFGDFVDPLDDAEDVAPIAVALLGAGKGDGQTLIAVETAQEVKLGAGLYHLELFVGDELVLEALDLLVDGGAQLLRRMAGRR